MDAYQSLSSAAEIRKQGLSLHSFLCLNDVLSQVDEGEVVRTRNHEIAKWCRRNGYNVIHGLFGSWWISK